LWGFYYNGQLLGECTSEQEAADALNAWHYDQERSGTLYQPRQTATLAGTRIERLVCTDKINVGRYGKEYGTRYLLGSGDDEVEVFVPDGDDGPQVFGMELNDGPDIGEVLHFMECIVPMAQRLLSDPQVLAAIAEAEARRAA
jgi:hypothetical protein